MDRSNDQSTSNPTCIRHKANIISHPKGSERVGPGAGQARVRLGMNHSLVNKAYSVTMSIQTNCWLFIQEAALLCDGQLLISAFTNGYG